MGYFKVDDRDTRIYIEAGMNAPLKQSIKNAQILQALVYKH